ncbi:MAG: VOC family protein [Cyanobacteria bacterium P01_F01_bin.53]
MVITQGTHHIGLTVPDIAATRDFFVNILGFEQIGEEPDCPAYFVSDGTAIMTRWQAADPANAVPFDRKNNIGLHHLAFNVKDKDTLNSMYQIMAETEGVSTEFQPEHSNVGPLQHFMAYIPGGIRMELISPDK